jgi:hypothetical protein
LGNVNESVGCASCWTLDHCDRASWQHVAGRSLEDKCVQVARCLVAYCKFEPSEAESAHDALDLCGAPNLCGKPILLDNYISPHGHPGPYLGGYR